MSNEKVTRSRLTLIILILVILSPIVISSVLHRWDFRPDHTVNYGELLEIKPLQGTATNLKDNTIFRSRQLKGIWSLLIIDSGKCDGYCQEKLYIMRQIRLAQNVDKDKVQRIWLINDDIKPDPEIVDKYEGTRLVLAQGRNLLDEFPFMNRQDDHIYVIDPMGNLMMRYPKDPDPKKMIGDLKRLLKLSHPEY
ncbi:Cytochrome oxidase Cu insertion factor, SCO1/SenC/PrrC family [Nitrosomonas eutropha]|uniref:Cytochrome oxidase Cu insertion factor, SCO1/SenC/PrrC family n=1 Tax=Nitrosomonas eutropha TaxID=916 RepID=A0A1I7HJD1_9PROT|nr:hypothetical protein [Nitrosomonas eutropha]SFU60785.1 Cytochrome oxidase Cu insertion factor, SCO1/SenC/PrrC family [Nitrosomonas eutropha]